MVFSPIARWENGCRHMIWFEHSFNRQNQDPMNTTCRHRAHHMLRSSESCPVLLLTSTLTGTCLALFNPRCLNWYLLFWNQFLICSSVMFKTVASMARSSRVRYCWRVNTSSKYLSCPCVKWLRFRFFFTALFDAEPGSSLFRLSSSVFLFPLAANISIKQQVKRFFFFNITLKSNRQPLYSNWFWNPWFFLYQLLLSLFKSKE